MRKLESLSRREVLVAGAASWGIAATAWTLSPPPPIVSNTLARVRLRPNRVIVDTRFRGSTAFAEGAQRRGITPITVFEGDLTVAWRDELENSWRTDPPVIAGLTATALLQCLELLGSGHRLRVVLRADHRISNRLMSHDVRGPAAALDSIRPAFGSDQWPRAIGASIADGFAMGAPRDASLDGPLAADLLETPTVLSSWVMAPIDHLRRLEQGI